MSLFKYLSPERIDVLKTLCLRYSQPAILNDPFEAKPHYTGLMPEAAITAGYPHRFRKILIEQYNSMSSEFKQQISFDIFAAELNYMRQEIYDILRQVDTSFVPEINAMMHESFSEKIGVFSLSEINDSQLMWSHYADSHRGFVLEFDESHSYFAQRNINADDLWQLHKIRYAPYRPQTTIIELDMQAILLTKHASWSYECEWKDFQPLNQASTIIEAVPLPIHLFNFPAECIRSVIFGARVLNATRALTTAAIKSNVQLNHLQIFEAKLDSETYTLHIQSV